MATALDFLLALIIGILLFPLGRRLRPDLRPVWLAIGLSMLFCFLTDGVLLAALPLFRLSFGPVGPPLFLISGVRMVFFAPALFILLKQPPKRRAVGLVVAIIFLQAALFAGEVDGLYIEPFRLGVTDLPIPAPAFLPDRPLRILQISDLHIERITKRDRDVLAQAESLQPDIIVLTGDYVNQDYVNDPQAWADARQIISQLHAPYGVYAVNGTVDDPAHMLALFSGLGNVRVLDDSYDIQAWPGGKLALVGVTNTVYAWRDVQALSALMAKVPPEAYTILLYHTPDLIKTASSTGVDLYLAGHTHGGQIRLPFYGAVVTFSKYGKKYEMGEYRVGTTTLYVSRGLGMEGLFLPRARFLCPPELVMVELGK